MYNEISDFSILKVFGISIRPRKVSKPIQVLWSFPLASYIKVNIDCIVRDFIGLVACAEIFRGGMGKFVGCFSSFPDI